MTDPSAFEIRTVEEGAAVRIVVAGELDLASVPELKGVLDHHRANGQGVVVDMRDVVFVDSSGLRLLVLTSATARRDRWYFGVESDAVPETLQRLIALTGTAESINLV